MEGVGWGYMALGDSLLKNAPTLLRGTMPWQRMGDTPGRGSEGICIRPWT